MPAHARRIDSRSSKSPWTNCTCESRCASTFCRSRVTARTSMPWADNRVTTSRPTVPVAPVIRIMAASPFSAQRGRLGSPDQHSMIHDQSACYHRRGQRFVPLRPRGSEGRNVGQVGFPIAIAKLCRWCDIHPIVSQCIRLTPVSFYPMLWQREKAETRAVSRARFLTFDSLIPFVSSFEREPPHMSRGTMLR